MPRSPLWNKLQAMSPRWIAHEGWEIPASFGPVEAPVGADVEAEYWALKNTAGLADVSQRGRLLVQGQDAPRFLHGMVTSDVQGLQIGHGNHAFLLNVQGHILAGLRILRLDSESFLLDCEPQSHDVVTQALDRHIISDIVELEDLRTQLACLALEGPQARQALSEALTQCFDAELPVLDVMEHVFLEAAATRVFRSSLCGEEGYTILASPDRAAKLMDAILAPANGVGETAPAVKLVGFEALEIRRIEAGIPRYGIDITEKNLPQETGQMYAVGFNKGCYIGQEVVERIRSRGHVNRELVRLLIEGRQDVAPETTILSGGQAVGSTGSSAYCYGLEQTVAFGYVRREHVKDGDRVEVGTLAAQVAELPDIALQERAGN